KEKPEYGLQYILAAFHSTDRFGTGIFGDNTEIQSLIELAQGRQSTEDIAKLFGKFRGTTSDYDDGPESLVYIDPQVLNLAPKYINRAVAKMQARAFDISLEAIDLPSIDAKEDYAASIQAFYRLKEWVQQMGIPLQDRKSTRLNSSHVKISYAVFCLKKKIKYNHITIKKHTIQ